MISVLPYCKADKVKKTGKAPIVIYLRQSGLPRKSITTGLNIEPKHFDNPSGRFKKGSGNMLKLNTRLDNILGEINEIILDNPEFNNADVFSFYKKGSKSTLFVPFARDQLRVEQKILAYKTWKMYDYFIGMIDREYPTLTLKQITADWLEEFRYLLKTKGLSPTTIKHSLTTIRKFVKIAIRKKLIQKNPFDEIKVGGQRNAKKEWTDMDEINRLKELYYKIESLPERLRGTLTHYLHAAHTGLRAVDQREFDPDQHVVDDFIYMHLSKTKGSTADPVRIPLNDFARELHPHLLKYPLKQSHSRIGDNLKDLCQMTGIKKHITFHCARHSFAINSLVVGVPLEVVSKWLGHTSVSTTQIYARIVDSLSGEQMKKWNKSASEIVELRIRKNEDQYYIDCGAFDLTTGPFNDPETAKAKIRSLFNQS